MAKKSLKCPLTVEQNQFGCAWSFSGMLDHHHNQHGRTHRKLLSDESHGSKTLPGAGHTRNQVRMLTFDEQLRSINTESKKKNANVNQSTKEETSSSNHTRKNDKVWKKTVEESFWKKIKSRYDNPNKKNENSNFEDRIVVLKPSSHCAVEFPVDVGCRCSYLHSYQSSKNKQQLIKQARASFNDVRIKIKNAKKMEMQNAKKMKSFKASEVGESNGNAIKSEKLSLVPFTKQQEPEVFEEARKHLAERLRLVAHGVDELSCSSSKGVSRTLERILLSSPIHESMASFGGELEGARSEKILQNTWSSSGPLKQNEYASASGFVEIMGANEFLRGDLKFSSMNSDPNNINLTGVDGHIVGLQLEFVLDVSSPKANCKLENIDNDQFRENPSPVSVLDSFFTDNISSPTSTIESVEHQLQPRCLDFEEHSQTSSPPHQKTSLSSFTEDRAFISSYVNDIYQISQSNWEDFLAMDCPLESSCDQQLIHHCVKEVLVSLRSQVRFVSSKVRPFSLEKDVVNEVIDQVDWHNGQPVGPRTLDLLVKRDIAKCGQWVDFISDGNDIVFEIVDETLQELIMEAIFDILI